MRLTLLIPELIWPEPADRQTLDSLNNPALGTLLARGKERLQPTYDNGIDALIASALGLPNTPPYAPLRLLGEGMEPGDSHWACADPVQLRFHQDRLILAEGRTIGITEDEAKQLVAYLNQYFTDTGEFRMATADRWYLRLKSPSEFRTPSLSAVAGRRIDQQLPEEASTIWLRKLLNEAQMLLHDHAVNKARSEAGKMTINSLWLWGPGKLSTSLVTHANQRFDAVWSNHPLVHGIALANGSSQHATPSSFAEFCASNPKGRQFILLEDLLCAVQYEDAEAWREAITALETAWFEPLITAIRAGKLELKLLVSTIYGTLEWKISRRDMWRLWKRPTSIGSVAQRLAGETA